MTLKVIGAGFGRTGTDSLKVALNQLGLGPCQHLKETNGTIATKLLAVKRGEDLNPDWDAIMGDYQSCVDWPWSAFYKELADFYPDAKVVLTVRDPEKWYTSVSDTIYKFSGWVPPSAMRNMVFGIIWDGIFEGRFPEKDHAIKKFNDHIEEVKANIPADRLLVFEVADGWGPLCEFLDVPIPEGPFPRVNTSAEMNKPWWSHAVDFVKSKLPQ